MSDRKRFHVHGFAAYAVVWAGSLIMANADFGDDPEPSCSPAFYRIIDLHDPQIPHHSAAYGINDFGEIVGDIIGSNNGAFVWLPVENYDLDAKKMIDLLTIIGTPWAAGHAIARDINIHGMVIGSSHPLLSAITLWDLSAGVATDLSAVLNHSGHGNAINNDYPWPTIAGIRHAPGADPDDSRDNAFLLIPRDWCPGDINAGAPDGMVNTLDLLELFANWGPCPDPCCCLADLNGDGVVDALDMLILQSNWGACPGFEFLGDPLSLPQVLDQSGLTAGDGDEFVSVMAGGTKVERENHLCWMKTYITQCVMCPTCPGPDPFAAK